MTGAVGGSGPSTSTADSDPAIRMNAVGKRYRLYEDTPVLVASGLNRVRRTKRSKLWALRGLDLEVAKGECLGVIGRNGSGKTTVLKLLAGVSAPTEGHVLVRGRVAPLMAVGVGFHQELTGRENVYLNATMLGVDRNEIHERLDDIIAFAEIGAFIDTPVKFYSSGMVVRLGFSVAIRTRPSVLLVDEILAVGDVLFQAKCLSRMQELRDDGATVVLVTHNLDAVRLLCDRTLVLHDGRPRFLGCTARALSIYHELIDEEREPEHEEPTTAASIGSVVHVEAMELLDANGQRTANFDAGRCARLRARFTSETKQPALDVEIDVTGVSGLTVYREHWLLESQLDRDRPIEVDLEFAVSLPTGSYAAMVNVKAPASDRLLASRGPLSFFVGGRQRVRGLADLRAVFDVHRR